MHLILTTNRRRRGASLVETAIMLLVFVILVLGMVDIGVGVLRFNTIAQASRHGARQAMVHGQSAPAGWNGGPWGPSAIDISANDPGPVADAIRPMLAACDLTQTRIVVEWPEGSNAVEKPVAVTVTTTYQPIVTFIFGRPTLTLRSRSTVPIAH